MLRIIFSAEINFALSQKDVSVEVIVVDDASSNRSCTVVELVLGPSVLLLRSNINAGSRAVINIGFKAARGK